MKAPVAAKKRTQFDEHGQTRVDDYYWLKDREDPEVIAYLNAENDYTETTLSHIAGFREDLYQEIVSRLDPTDESVPYRQDDYFYYNRYEDGAEYALFCRKHKSLEAEEEIVLNEPELAKGHSFFAVGGAAMSTSHRMIAYAVDTVGRRICNIRIRDLESKTELDETLPSASGSMAWSKDDRYLFYTRQHEETLRSHQIWRHELGTDPSQDVLIYEEEDTTFAIGVWRSKSKEFIFIESAHKVQSEFRFVRSDDPLGEFQVFLPRRKGHEYTVEHHRDFFYIHSNDAAQNFRMFRCPVSDTSRSTWEEIVPHREDVLLEDMEIFNDFLVLGERKGGLIRLRVREWESGDEHYVAFDEPAYTAHLYANRSFDTKILRFYYTSLTTPGSVYDYDMKTRERELLKRDRVLGGEFKVENYVTERLHAKAGDGVHVPISLVYHKDTRVDDGSAPLLLYGYGSYGSTMDASFSSARLSLIDRGFVFAIAHIRGSEALGRAWYENGKMMKKKNTFTDFIDCGEHLIAKKMTSRDRIFAYGGSAGGLLMGAVMNMRPDLFHGVVAAVPFVDVVTTMLDESIPLTTMEYDEWGNPNEPEAYAYIRSYSPYDNVRELNYPHLLVTTGLHDSQVQYWEPAKWVAKLRDLKVGHNRLLLHTNMDAGHGGASGRFEQFKEVALRFAFLLDLAGKVDPA